MPRDTTEALTMAGTKRAADQIMGELWLWLITKEVRLAAQVRRHADAGDELSEAKAAGALGVVCRAIELLEAGH